MSEGSEAEFHKLDSILAGARLKPEDLELFEQYADRGMLGERVRLLREARGMTGERLAELCDMHLTNISHIEMGYGVPKFHAIKKMSAALEIPFEELRGFAKSHVSRLISEIRSLWREIEVREEQIELCRQRMRNAANYLNRSGGPGAASYGEIEASNNEA